MEGIADFHGIKDFHDINYFHGILFIVQRVQYINQIKGRQFVSSEQILNYLANPETPDIHREIFFTFKEHGVFDETKAITIQEAADLLVKDKDYLGIQLGIMASIGFLSKTVQVKESDVNKRKYKLKSYYLSRQHIAPVGKTMLPEKVFTKVEKPNTTEKKKTGPSPEKKENAEAKEIFDIYLKLYPKKGAYKYRQEKIERAIKDYDFETIKSIVQWFPKNEWWNKAGRVDLYNNILAPTRIDDWISQMSLKSKPVNAHVTPIFRNDLRMEAKLRLERQEREHEKFKEPPEFNVLEELGGF